MPAFPLGRAALRRLRCFALVLAALPAPIVASPAGPAVQGLIVQLRDAPPHQGRHDKGARTARTASVRAEAARWHALLADPAAGLSDGVGAARRRPAGRAAWRVTLARPLDAGAARALAARIAQRPEVAWAEPDTLESLQQAELPVPNDPLFGGDGGQWWLGLPGGSDGNAIAARRRGVPGVQRAWSRGVRESAAVVAVLDTGITAHPDLDPARLLPGYDMVSDWDAATARGRAADGDGRDADPTDPGDGVSAADRDGDPQRYGACALAADSFHGSAVIGMLAAATDNALGGASVAWSGPVLPVRVSGRCGAQLSDVVDGMRWAAGLPVCKRPGEGGDDSGCAEWAPRNPRPARVVNVSIGGDAACGAAYRDAVAELHALGIVVVAAAGNGRGAITRPANCPGVIGVVALNRDGFKAGYSNFGAEAAIATVGGDDADGRWGPLLGDGGLLSIDGSGGHARHTGTSFAAPIVSGTVALMLAADPRAGPDEIAAGLAASARPHVVSRHVAACSPENPARCLCAGDSCGAGVLDAGEAVAHAQALAAGEAYRRPNWAVEWIGGAELEQAEALGPDLAHLPTAEAPTASQQGNTGGGALDGATLAALLSGWLALAWAARRQRTAGRSRR